MKVYIQAYKNGIPHNFNSMNAFQDFYEMKVKVIPFHEKVARLLPAADANII